MSLAAIDSPVVQQRTLEYLRSSYTDNAARVDKMMIWLLGAEWLGMMATALIVSPRVWNGSQSSIHPHLWAAILAGPAFILPVIAIALLYPAKPFTRHAIAVAQILVSALLIDCTGGRIETHFHVFGSLAFLAFYRDWRVLVTASLVTAADHFVRGIWWPESVYGIIAVSPWRWVEHAWWVAFEDFFLFISMQRGLRESKLLAESKARLYEGASHDVLTGLPNRRLLQERFDAWGAANESQGGALLFLDLDRFKQANDTLGHTVGDKLLSLVSGRLLETVDPLGTLARIGGDEFVVLLDHGSPAAATSLANRLLESLTEPFHIDEHELLLSASVGISLFPDHGTTLGLLQERADRAMYVAKARGRNQCVVFSREVSRREELAREIAADLSPAFPRGEFHLLFQPLVRQSGEVTGFEALLRWQHPRRGLIAPADFISLAEKSGMIVRLGDWVLREACRNCRGWQELGHSSIGVAVNVSAVQFDLEDYPERVFAVLAETGIEPSLLTLELTEGILVRNPARTRANLTRIRLAGVRIALDDFGTGYSSLSYLADLPADVIKLDRTFINREMPGTATVVESVITMAHRLGLRVVAEGVETEAQKDGLLDANCDELQGYYFSKPIPADAVADLLGTKACDKAGTLADTPALLAY
jgi:diguanylate cyclase (GGDEF)-like protein